MKKFTSIIALLVVMVATAAAQSVSYTVSNGTGTLANYSSGQPGNWNYKWSFNTTSEQPAALTIAASNNANNIAPNGDNLKFFGGSANTCTYVLSVPAGYLIESYSLNYVTSGNVNATLTPAGGSAVTSSTTSNTLRVNNVNSRVTTLTVSGGNVGFEASNFVIKIKPITLTEVGNPTTDGVYRIYWKQNQRGYLAYHNDYHTKGVLADVTLGSYGSSHFNTANDPVQLEWYLITSEAGNKYLFNAYNGKFLSYSNESADNAKAAYFDAARPCPITIENNTSHSGYYIIKANVNGTDCLLSSGCGTASKTGYPVRWNSNISGDMGDGGSPLIFVAVEGVTVAADIMAQAKAAIEDYENPVENNITFGWTTSTKWEVCDDYASTTLSDNALDGGIKYIEGQVTVGGARTATVTFTYIDGGHKLNIRGVEVINAGGYVVAGDYHVGTAGGSHEGHVYTVKVAEAGTYTVRCYVTEGNGDSLRSTNGSIEVAFAKLNVMDLTKAVTIGSAGYATLYLGYKVAIPAGVKAYVVSAIDEWATLSEVENVIPAVTPVILQASAGTYNFYYTSDNEAYIEDNLLDGTLFDCYVEGAAYVLANGDNGVGFYNAELDEADGTAFFNNANKAYLPAEIAQNTTAFYGFLFEGTTGVENVVVENGAQVIFDLTGRRIESINAAGIYIVNGRKVLVK